MVQVVRAFIILCVLAIEARATCIETRVAGLPQTCCTDDATGETICRVAVPKPPPPPPPPPALDPADDPGTWDEPREGRWNFELVAGPTIGGLPREVAEDGTRVTTGVDLKLRARYRRERGETATARILGIIPALLVGTELGVELRAGTFVTGDGDRTGAFVAIRPVAVLAFERYSAPAILNHVPEIGFSKIAGRPAALHWAIRFPFGLMIRRRLGLELELGIGPDLGYAASLAAVVR